MLMRRILFAFFILCFFCISLSAIAQVRSVINLDNNWLTIAADSNEARYAQFYTTSFDDNAWKKVDVPHNWDQYEGYRRLRHGNKHGYAWYRKTFTVSQKKENKHFFLFFAGVGSYATVWLNGKLIGSHAGGRTTFTLDASAAIKTGANILAVRAGHPAFIQDLPWICGGCSDDRGWSEGSQPMGIFRPVSLLVTNAVRIQPFGVHVWTKEQQLSDSVHLLATTEIKNYDSRQQRLVVQQRLLAADGSEILNNEQPLLLAAGELKIVEHHLPILAQPHLWSPEDPYLYKVVTTVISNQTVLDSLVTDYGVRWVTWPTPTSPNRQFLVNGKPVFINGTCEYEHLMGRSHAFDSAQVRARVMQIKAGGFNAFRDAHQPHNLLYSKYWNELGMLNWTQFSAHAWYDDSAFKSNFKLLLADWVKERRNDPSVIMWGLQNESKLPEAFAAECTAIIRELDPSASLQRPVTTCNGGEGTDWNVPQNWSGTYGGDPSKYGEDLKRQLLVGEYGAWRTLELHTEGGFDQDGIYSEDRMTQLMEMKVKEAEAVRDSVAGHFHWLFASHENPGRVQSGEAYRELDRVGPVNYKGLFTPWAEPLGAFYMYRANYVPTLQSPMVYIVSHTWPDRWLNPGIKDSIVVYSNCDEVELFNDVNGSSLGIRTRNGVGTHFQWDKADIKFNILFAEGRVNGKTVARDTIILHHLPAAPHLQELFGTAQLTMPAPKYNYLYRVNCGGAAYIDSFGNAWLSDAKRTNAKTWGSTSWTDDFQLPAFYASQRNTTDAVGGTRDWPLFQHFRYGMDKLKYEFPVKKGKYRVELYFSEPWYGRGGGLNCEGWRQFDIAINGKTVEKDFDIWKQAGYNHAFKKVYEVEVTGNLIEISLPTAEAGEAIISAIAIASRKTNLQPAVAPKPLIDNVILPGPVAQFKQAAWLQTGDTLFRGKTVTFGSLPAVLSGCEWFSALLEHRSDTGQLTFSVTEQSDVFLAFKDSAKAKGFAPADISLQTDENGGTVYQLYKKRFRPGQKIELPFSEMVGGQVLAFAVPVSGIEPAYDLKPVIRFEAEKASLQGATIAPEPYGKKDYVRITDANAGKIGWKISPGVADRYALHFRYINHTGKPVPMNMYVIAADGTIMYNKVLEFPPTDVKWATVDADTGSYINAGDYTIELRAIGTADLGFDYLELQ